MRIPSGVTDQYIYFVAVDATDLKTRETGLSSFTVYRSRNGAAAAAMTTPTVNEVDATNMPGVYELLLDEDMTIGAGNDTEEMCFHITATGMDPVTRVIELFRPKITAGNTLGVASDGDISGNVDGTVNTVTTLTNLPSIPANWLTAAGIAASALNGKGDWNIGKTGYALTVQDWNTTTPPTVAAIRAEMDSNSTQLAAIVADTAEIGAAGAGLTAVPWNAAWDAEVQSEVQDAIEANHLDHLLAVDYNPASKPGVATALLNELVEDDAGVSRFTVNALENGPSGSGASAAAIADAVWDEALSGHLGAGSTGEALNDASAGGGPTAAAIADAVWDEAQADHVAAGSFGVIASEIATIEGKVDTVDTVVDGIQTDLSNGTDGLGAIKTAVDAIPTTAMRGTDNAATAAALATAQADLDDIQARLPAALVSGRIDANVAAINDSAAAAVRLALSAGTMVPGTVDSTVTPTTTVFEADDITELTADHYNGRQLIFTSGALNGQATSISDYALNGGRGQFTVVALTEAPANNDTFIIV